MFSQNNEEKKLDWMYKGPGGAVDREEYLLGRSVDKSLEQLNAAEKSQSGANPPKNHVEHECIPPSIRDFKRQQLGEQVDLAQKLQEDPLIAIKKQEEEARQRLLQNPVQLKKLQKVLKIKNSKKKKKKNKRKRKSDTDSDSDSSVDNLDRKLSEKYAKMKNHLNISTSDDDELDKLLISKFMKFRHLLTKSDLDEILHLREDGNKKSKKYDSSSDSDKPQKFSNKKKYNSSSEDEIENRTSKQMRIEHSKSYVRKSDRDNSNKWKNRKYSSSESDTDSSQNKRNRNRNSYTRKETNNSYSKKETNFSDRRYNMAANDNKRKRNKEHREDETINRDKNEKMNITLYVERKNQKLQENANPRRSHQHEKNDIKNVREEEHRKSSKKGIESIKKSRSPEDERRRRRETRQSAEKYAEDGRNVGSSNKYREDNIRRESKNKGKGSKSKNQEIKKASPESTSEDSNIVDDDGTNAYYDSDDYDEKLRKKRNFGLIKADGTKILQNKYKPKEESNKREAKKEKLKVDGKLKVEKDYKSRLTEAQKEQIRREMMKNAAWREQEIVQNVTKYREESKQEEKQQEYNPEFINRQLMKTASNCTVESRIKSNVNNIQRSSKDMNSHFSRRN